LRLPSRSVSLNNGSWVLGVQEATTTRLRSCSFIYSFIFSWVSWEQVNRFVSATTTLGRVSAYALTFGTSTTPPMLMPQWQTNTPMRGASPTISFSTGYSFFLTRLFLTGARRPMAVLAAALASITVPGISLGP
jgi:hypothetical protein